MSKTSMKERNKAIRLAWEKEQQLVREGKGTRDWTKEQQKDILDPDKGKAYDESGRAFEGQHMKSAAEYPEYQGDPDNIQFLTREEHREAHKGSWQNPTNWFYNPETKEYIDFGDNKPTPCEVINLSDPVCSPVIEARDNSSNIGDSDQSEVKRSAEQSSQPLQQENTVPHSESAPQRTPVAPPEIHQSIGDKILHVVDAVKEFTERHPIIVGIIKWGGAAAIAIGAAAAANSNSNGSRSSGDSESDSSSSLSDDYSGLDDDSDSFSTRDYPSERSSPREHDVSGYDRQQNGKTVHVKQYKRGGKHEDD